MAETQESIAAWIAETFGEEVSNARIVARANEEMAELLKCVTTDEDHPKIGEELADVAICLCRLGPRLGVDVLGQEKPFTRENWDEHWLIFHQHEARPVGNAQSVAIADYHLVRLLMDVLDDRQDALSHSMARVVICLHLLSERLGTDLQTEVEKKMAVNRARVWKRDGTGCGYHV